MKKRILLLLVVLLAGCNLPTGNPESEVSPLAEGDAPMSTATSRPTFTLRPTHTATLTFTPTATPYAVNWRYVGLPTGAEKAFLYLWFIRRMTICGMYWGIRVNLISALLCFSVRMLAGPGKLSTPRVIMRPLVIDPGNGNILYSDDNGKLIRSTDRGHSWAVIHEFDDMVESIHISTIDGAIYVGQRWYNNTNPGIHRSDDRGETWEFFPFGADIQHFIPWDIAEDPNTGILYVVIEIADHPKPYDPPFYRSTDRGETWKEVGEDDLTWHGFAIQVDPLTSDVYFLSEGTGLTSLLPRAAAGAG